MGQMIKKDGIGDNADALGLPPSQHELNRCYEDYGCCFSKLAKML